MSTQRVLEWVLLAVFMVLAVTYWLLWRRARAQLEDAASDRDVRPVRALRRKMLRLNHGQSPMHHASNTEKLVLEAAMAILEADRGLLLGRDDADGDGNLDVICAIGFDADPESDPFVQRIGERSLDRDETVREANAVAMPVYIADEFDGALICAKDDGDFSDYDDDLLLALGDHAGAVLDNSQMRSELRAAYVGTVRSLADAIEAKDPAVRTHSEEVARYVSAVAARMDLDPRRREELLFASLLHDVGKIGISDRILFKPDRLTREEFNIVKLHPRIGHRIVSAIPALTSLAPAVLHHHERFDGSGYPMGLEGERIPLEARIVGVADSFSAMVADRPYARGRSAQEACAELERCAGTQFDPEVVRLFVDEVRAHPLPAIEGEVSDAALEAELAVHRDGSDQGPLGEPAYALVDNLTLLHSCSHLHELLGAEARRAAVQQVGFGLVLIEMEHLHAINRQSGFAEGDRAVLQVAAVLRRTEAELGGVACRASGRRFAVVLPRADAAAAAAAAERLTAELRNTQQCSVQAVTWQPGDDAFALLDRARRELSAA
jgi:diguanylate cyclase (GGDEF)-like protein